MTDSREQLVRELFGRWNAGKRELDPELVSPNPIVHSALTGGDYRGQAKVREWIGEIDEQFDSWRLTTDQFRLIESDHLLSLGTVYFRGRASGVEFDQPIGWLFRFEEGRIAEMWNFSSHDAAREAAGSVSS